MPDNLSIVFMGTPEFAVPSLRILHEAGYEIPCVVTAPDKPAGRGRTIHQSPVKMFAESIGLKVVQPKNLKDPEFITYLQQLAPDIIVVVAFRMLPEVVWKIPSHGTINLHASLLPDYRGAAPINWVIINGERETGVTTFFIDEEIDTGKILLSDKIPVHEIDNAGSLHDRLKDTGAELLLTTVQRIADNDIKPVEQKTLVDDSTPLKKAPKILKEDCLISWEKPVRKIVRQIRGLSPYPAAYTYLMSVSGVRLLIKIYEAEAAECEKSLPAPGTLIIVDKEKMQVSGMDGFVNILTVQQEGKRKLSVKEFLIGFREPENWRIVGDAGT